MPIQPQSSGDVEEDLRKLTAKQRIYVESRIGGMNVMQSCAAAGLKSAGGIEKNPRISQILLHANKAALTKLVMTREDVLAGFMDAVNSSASATELVMAWREIGKVIGAYEPEVKVVVSVDLTAEKIAAMGDDALLRLSGMEDFENPDMKEDILEGEYTEVEGLGPEDQGLSTSTDDPSPPDIEPDTKIDAAEEEC
jgi:hypothetical protein